MAARNSRLAHIRYTNHIQCLCCYLICFGLPAVCQYFMTAYVYPFKLTHTAPDIALSLAAALPFAWEGLEQAVSASSLTGALDAGALRRALTLRDALWTRFLDAAFLVAWLGTLAAQLTWRLVNARYLMAAKRTAHAIRAYRFTQSGICLMNALIAFTVWQLGVQYIGGKTAWDYLCCFTGYALNPLAAFLCFRLAAPASLSGRHAFFKRL